MQTMSTLYVVPTPIGNVKDITVRAKEVLTDIEIVLSEDTRVTSKLLKLLEIEPNKNLISYFEHNERKKLDFVLDLLKQGNDVALLSDAGTPLLSDPGFPLIREIRKLQKEDPENYSEIKVEVLPGATSVTTALVASGFPTDKFTFLGFTPRKPSDKKKMFRAVRKANDQLKASFILFENQYRLLSTLNLMKELLGKNVDVCICKELTKLHETIEYGRIEDVIELVEKNKISLKGEIVLVFNLNIDN